MSQPIKVLIELPDTQTGVKDYDGLRSAVAEAIRLYTMGPRSAISVEVQIARAPALVEVTANDDIALAA